MASLINTGTQAQVTAANSITTNSPSATAGNKLVLCIGWVLGADAGSAQTLTAPSGWTADHNPASAENVGGGPAGWAVFSKTAAGGIESPVINTPTGSGNFYADSIITEWNGMGAHDSNDSSAIITDNAGGASSGTTVPNTGTLATANSTVFTGVAMLCGSGLANQNFAFSGGSWNTLFNDGNTNASVGTLTGYKVVSTNAALGAVYTWTNDVPEGVLCFQASVVVFSDVVASTSQGFVNNRGFGLGPNIRKGFIPRFLASSSPNNDVTIALTGVSGTFSLGALTALFQSMDARDLRNLGPGRTPDYIKLFQPRRLAADNLTVNNLTVSLTGISGAFALGTLGVNFTVPLVGISGSWTLGTVTPNFLISLTGQAGTFSPGNLTPSIQVALTGAAITSAQGTLIPVLTLGLSGLQITSAVGSMAPSSQVQLTGQPLTATLGIMTPSGGTPVVSDTQSFTGFICNVGTLLTRQ